MTDEPKPYGAILVDAAKRHGTAGAAGLAVALSIAALATGGSEPSAPTAASSPTTVEQLDLAVPAPQPTGPRKRLDIATDVEIAAGASVTASGQVELGARLVPLASCVGQYSEATRICVLSPGPWELHSSCEEAPLAPATTCTIVVKNTGALASKFAGYVEVAAP